MPVKALVIVALGSAAAALTLWIRSMVDMPLRSHRGPLPPLSESERRTADALSRHVGALAGEIGERNLWRRGSLAEAARYIRYAFASQGYGVAGQGYIVEGEEVSNLEVEIPGRGSDGGIVIIGAHYDSVPGCPGANDNASGVAALLELGRLLRGAVPESTVRLVAFVNEEPPFFQGGQMGSRVYARRCRERGERITAMLSLETIGSYSDEPGSQSYPPPFSLLYPDRGDFIAFVSRSDSAPLVRRCLAAFRQTTPFPSEGIAVPAAVTGVGWSDHWSFWQEGYPALMVTDTAFFRYPYYHTAEDRPGRLDYERTARVVEGLARVVAALAGMPSGTPEPAPDPPPVNGRSAAP